MAGKVFKSFEKILLYMMSTAYHQAVSGILRFHWIDATVCLLVEVERRRLVHSWRHQYTKVAVEVLLLQTQHPTMASM